MRLIDIEPLIDDCDEIISIEWNYKVAPPSWADAEEEFRQRLLDAPTIDPASLRPKGEWIMKETLIRSPYAKNAYCSECLEETSYNHNFCPNCGADMRGDKHG